MAQELTGRKVAFIVSNEGIEQAELTRPWQAVEKAGGEPVLAAKEPGKAQAYNHLDKADRFDVDITTDRLKADDYAGVVIPGGVANGDRLRTDEGAVRFLRDFVAAGKPVAVICHGPWILTEIDAVRGRRMTSWPSLRTDLRNAGADWVDEQVVVCSSGPNTLITSRKPDDLDAFCRELIKAFSAGSARAAA